MCEACANRLHRTRCNFFFTPFGQMRTQTRKEVLNKSGRGARWSCRSRVEPEARILEHHRDFGSLPHNCGARDMMRQRKASTTLSTPTQVVPQPSPGQTDRDGCDKYTDSAVRGQCLFVLQIGIGDFSYRAPSLCESSRGGATVSLVI